MHTRSFQIPRRGKQTIQQPAQTSRHDLRKKNKTQKTHDMLQSKSNNQSTALLNQTIEDQLQKTQNFPILCREEQQQAIHEFMCSCLLGKINSKTLYISGVPGVGKTMTALKTMTEVQKQCKGVKVCHLNAMKLKKPHDIYEEIYLIILKEQGVKGAKLKKSIIGIQLQSTLSRAKNHYFFLVDEVDYLMTKDQAVYYNLFDWACSFEKFSLIIIANTMNFPEKLAQKICSRLGRNRLVFKPYSQKQILKIISQRVSNPNVYDQNAMVYASKKMAGFTSDLRKILEIIRRAQEQRGNNKITIQKFVNLWSEYPQGQNQFFQHLPEFYLNILNAIKEKGGRTDSQEVLLRLRNSHFNYSSRQLVYGLNQMSIMGLIKTQKANRKGAEITTITLLKM